MVQVPETTLGEIAAQIDRPYEGDPETRISGVASLVSAGPGDLVYARASNLLDALAPGAGAAVIVPRGVDVGPRGALRSDQPELDFSAALAWMTRSWRPPPGIDPDATVAADAKIDASAHVGPRAVVGAAAVVGPGTALHAGSVLCAGAQIGRDCIVHSGAVIREGAEVGDRVWIHAAAVIGNEGYGYTFDGSGRPRKVPQVGRVVLEDDVEIGAGTTVQRGSLDETRIGRNAKIGDLCVIGHNSTVGEDVMMIGHTAIAGSVTIERGAIIMGQVAISGHLTIGAGALIGARAGIHKDVRPKARVYGTPGVEERAWHRSTAAVSRLPELFRRVRELERRAALEGDEDDASS